jgi:uncharacterized alpha-E superfamily protein
LLARYAEAIFWMARYMERAENLARIIDVNETFARDRQGTRNWQSVIAINADGQRFAERHGKPTAESVADFYVLDTGNPTSIISAVRYARENARALRPLISTEMWAQLNVFHNRLHELTTRDIRQHNLPRLCAMVKESCQTHTGITEGTFYRDQGWYFYQLGKFIERADQTTRLLDIKYHILLPSADAVGSPVDVSQWNAVLRSAAGYHAFRRIYPRGMSPAAVAGFLLFNESFPRSVATCTRQVEGLLVRLKSRYMLEGGNTAMEQVDQMMTALHDQDIDTVIQGGLHEYLDSLQLRLGAVTAAMSTSFFGQQAAETQEQSQGF